ADVRPYIYETLVKRVEVKKLPKDLTDISDLLRKMLDEYGRELIRMGFMSPARPMSKKYLLQIQSDLQTRLRNNERTTYVYRGMVVQSICMKILHGMLLVETQGMTPFKAYVRSLKDEMFGDSPSKSTKELIKRDEFVKAVKLASESKVEHPKISRVMGLASQMLSEHPESKVMVFAQFRDMCDLLVKKLSALENAKVEKLIGQADGGLKQREQIQLLDRFRKGEVNIVVSTSVGEEGLDVSSTDMVIFYEPVPDAIRMIQRRGRTGRKNDGEVFVMVALNTMDEAFESASAKKEERMREMLSSLNYELSRIKRNTVSRGQMTLGDFS
ncbi:MAG: ATP-dependent RNA helicase, partial [Candidatus Methanomethylophilaceae archaeon]|nr:ATP-dependent RNA helicase [Candidatus Methanomethylophilaceae archaeon]